MIEKRYKANYKKVCQILVEFVEGQKLFSYYPLSSVKLEEIILNNGWRLERYSEFDIEKCEISEEGYTIYENGIFTIYYNYLKLEERKCFTLGHEIGHIILNHHVLHKKDLICDNFTVVNELEKEANCFSRNLLAPAKVIYELQEYKGNSLNVNDVKNIFNVSTEFSKNRIGWVLEKDNKYCNFEDPNIFDYFIEESKPKVDYYTSISENFLF